MYDVLRKTPMLLLGTGRQLYFQYNMQNQALICTTRQALFGLLYDTVSAVGVMEYIQV